LFFKNGCLCLFISDITFSSLVYSACVEPQIDAYGQVSPFSVLAHTICLSTERKAERERNERNEKRLRQEQQELRRQNALKREQQQQQQDAWKREQEVRDIQLEVKRLKLQRELDQLMSEVDKVNGSKPKDKNAQKNTSVSDLASETAAFINKNHTGKTSTNNPNHTVVNAYSFKESIVIIFSHKLTLQEINERMSIPSMREKSYSATLPRFCASDMLTLLEQGFSRTGVYISDDGKPLYQIKMTLKDCI
jgi:hypothetical protein